MSARPRKRSFMAEVGFALVLALVVGAVGLTLALLVPPGTAVRLVVAGVGLAFVARTLGRAAEPTGRVTVAVVWTLAAVALWFAGTAATGTGLALYVAIHVGMIWLVRSLYAYSRVTEALLDLGLTALAASFAVWALVRTDGFFLPVWCFALGQALHVAIPGIAARLAAPREGIHAARTAAGRTAAGRGGNEARDRADENFARARIAADEALTRLAARRP